MKRIYLDHAATTLVDKEVVDTMLPYFIKYIRNHHELVGGYLIE